MKTKQNTKLYLQRATDQHFSVSGIEISLTRKHVKNINLRITPDGSVHVSAPARVPLAEIESFVASREAWIRARLTRVASREQAETQVGIAGSSVYLWGNPFTLTIATSTTREKEHVDLVGNKLVMTVKPRYAGDDEEARAHREKLLSTWQRQELSRILPSVFEHYAQLMGRAPSKVRIRYMTSRWGSCNTRTGSITINLALVEYPQACLESVVVHELCHLFEANHGPRFYALMDRYYPSWPEARAQLKARPLRRHALT